MVSLGDALLVNEFELRNDCPDLQFAFTVEIRNIADNEVIGVEGNRVALFDQTPEVGMSRPLLKFDGGSGEILRDVRL